MNKYRIVSYTTNPPLRGQRDWTEEFANNKITIRMRETKVKTPDQIIILAAAASNLVILKVLKGLSFAWSISLGFSCSGNTWS